MMQTALRETLYVDEKHQVHIDVPFEMGDEVEVIVIPCLKRDNSMSDESFSMARMMDDSGFAREILNSTEEDCWNDL